MGYTTDFSGYFDLNKPLSKEMANFLKKFNETRRMGRRVDASYGVQGEFYVDGSGFMGQDNDSNVINHNEPPITQPGLWCQWKPTEDGDGIEWDGGEKFYNYTEWLIYLIHKVLAPNGYVLNGTVKWQGEDVGDVGKIIVENNKVFTEPWDCTKVEMTPETASKYSLNGDGVNFMRTDVVYKIDEVSKEETKGKITLMVDTETDSLTDTKNFATWVVLNTQDPGPTTGVCRRYKGRVLNMDELYAAFKK